MRNLNICTALVIILSAGACAQSPQGVILAPSQCEDQIKHNACTPMQDLLEAVAKNDIQAAQALLEEGYSQSRYGLANSIDLATGKRPIDVALEHHHMSVAKLLLSHGAVL